MRSRTDKELIHTLRAQGQLRKDVAPILHGFRFFEGLAGNLLAPSQADLGEPRPVREAGVEAAVQEGAFGGRAAFFEEAGLLSSPDPLHVEFVAARPGDFVFLFAVGTSYRARDLLS
jgi:hypothetical protein